MHKLSCFILQTILEGFWGHLKDKMFKILKFFVNNEVYCDFWSILQNFIIAQYQKPCIMLVGCGFIFTAKDPPGHRFESSELDFDDDISEVEPHPPKKRTVPTVIRWENGGQQVLLSGSFNDWKAKIPMNYR